MASVDRFRSLVATGALLAFAGVSPAEPAPLAATTAPASPPTAQRALAVAEAAGKFGGLALGDYRLALALYATPEAALRFDDLDRRLWPGVSPRAGWSYFVGVSLRVLGGAGGPLSVVAFYNPWVDAFLLTAWRMEEGRPWIVDAELLMGDWVRRRGQPPLAPTPAWLRGDLYRPAALSVSVSEAVRAFEAIFPPLAAFDDWRARLPGLDVAERLSRNDELARHHLLAAVVTIDELRTPAPASSAPRRALRALIDEILARASEGKVASLLQSAPETLPPTRKRLLDAPPETFRALRPVALVGDPVASLVFLVPVGAPGYCVALLVDTRTTRPRLRRIDLVDYAAAYATLGAQGRRVPAGGPSR